MALGSAPFASCDDLTAALRPVALSEPEHALRAAATAAASASDDANTRLTDVLVALVSGNLDDWRNRMTVCVGLGDYRVRDGVLVRISRVVATPAEIQQVLASPDWPDAVEQVLARGVGELRLRVWTAQGWAQPTAENVASLMTAASLVTEMTSSTLVGAGIEVRLTLNDGEQFVRALLLRV